MTDLPAIEDLQKPSHGISVESCSQKTLGLSRFKSQEKLYQPAEKSLAEQLLNPFGDPWASRKDVNRYIPTMTGSVTSLVLKARGGVALPLAKDQFATTNSVQAYRNYSEKSHSPFHYDETVTKIAPAMPEFQKLKERFEAQELSKRFIGYAVLNYDDRFLFPERDELPEHFYLHHAGSAGLRADRLNFKDASTLIASGHIFDIRRPEVRTALCDRVLKCMVDNGVDGVLIDYAVRRYGFGAPAMMDEMPEGWFESFQDHQFALMTELYEKLDAGGRLLFLNGVMLDSIRVTEFGLVNSYLRHCHGMFWEQPFRWEWRDYNNGTEDYYQRLEAFFALIVARKKLLVVKCGTYRFHATEDIDPSWTSRYQMTDHGIERHLASYFTCLFLLFYTRYWHVFYYTHPTDLYDIYCSEPFFRIWDSEIGDAVTGRVEYSKHVQIREFENAFVFVNNTLKPVVISPRNTPPGLETRLPRLTLAPLSGRIWVKPSAVRRQLIAKLRQKVGKIVRGGVTPSKPPSVRPGPEPQDKTPAAGPAIAAL